MKYNKHEILKGAFIEFMARGYDSTTISDLQKKLGMSRGGMYRHYKNKEDLFISVIDEYIFSYFNRITLNVTPVVKIPEMINYMYDRHLSIIDGFVNAGATYHNFLNFTGLLIQAAKHYPGFLEKFKKIQQQIERNWKLAFKNSLQQGEIRKDIDVNLLCKLFSTISAIDGKTNKIEGTNFSETLKKEAKEKNKTLLYLYQMIKVE